MKQCRAQLVAVCVLACATVSSVRAADDCDAGTYATRLIKRYDSCLQKHEDLTAYEKRVKGDFDKGASAAREIPPIAMRLVGQRIEAIGAMRRDGSDFLKQRVELLLRKAESAHEQISMLNDPIEIDSSTQFPLLKIDEWKLISDDAGQSEASRLAKQIPAEILEKQGCLDEREAAGGSKCAAAFGEATKLGDEVYRVSVIVWELRQTNRAKFLEEAQLREKRWHGYLYDTKFQYFWELGINRGLDERCSKEKAEESKIGLVYRGIVHAVGKECKGIVTDAAGNRTGYRETPDFRAVFLHPDVGIEYVSHEPSGQHIKPALIFEWFGMQWWDWKGESVSNLKGLSVVTTVADLANENKIGWGLQGQYGDYAIALTNHGGYWAITFNLTLVGRISTINTKWSEDLKAAAKP